MKRNEQKSGVRSAISRIAGYMHSSMGIIVAALILAVLGAAMTIIGPDKVGRVAMLVSDGLTSSIDLAAIAKIGIFLVVIYALSATFNFIQHCIIHAQRIFKAFSHPIYPFTLQ